jgi:hypothetical protein
MIKDVISYLDYSVCAEISLALFVAVFLSVSIRTLVARRDSMNQHASIVLEEGKRID